MPATPLYAHHLERAIGTLEASSSEWIDRRALEEALGVSKWTAWRILKRCGAFEGPGRALVSKRVDLLDALRRLQQDPGFSIEVSRRGRVEDYLDGIARYASARNRPIVSDDRAAEMVGSRFAHLPAGVDLRVGELRIEFQGPQDFLEKLGAVVYALQNDFEAVSDFLTN